MLWVQQLSAECTEKFYYHNSCSESILIMDTILMADKVINYCVISQYQYCDSVLVQLK